MAQRGMRNTNRATPAIPAKAGKPAIPATPSPKAAAKALTTPSRTRTRTENLTDMGEGFSVKQPKRQGPKAGTPKLGSELGDMTRTRTRKRK